MDVNVEKKVNYYKEIDVPVERIVEVPVEQTVEEEIYVPIDRIIEREVEDIVERRVEYVKFIPKFIENLIYVEVNDERTVEVPVEVIVDRPIKKEKIIEKPVYIEKIVEKEVEVIVEKIIEVPVEKIVEVPIEVIIEDLVPIEKIIEIPIFIEKIIERPREVLVEEDELEDKNLRHENNIALEKIEDLERESHYLQRELSIHPAGNLEGSHRKTSINYSQACDELYRKNEQLRRDLEESERNRHNNSSRRGNLSPYNTSNNYGYDDRDQRYLEELERDLRKLEIENNYLSSMVPRY